MKHRVKRVETRQELCDEHDNWYGGQNVYLTKEDIDHLLKGGYLFFDDGEYSHGLIYDENGDMDEVSESDYIQGA